MPRRGKGEGSISQRSDGLWVARVEIGRDITGKRIRKAFYGKSKKEVASKLALEMAARINGTAIHTGKMTVADLLARWLNDSAKPTCSPGTFLEYKRIVETHINPRIGSCRLATIKPLHVQSMLAEMEKEGAGARTRQYCYATIHRAFVVAMRWQLLVRNPCDGVDPPRVRRRQITPISMDQARDLLNEIKSSRFHALFVLALTTGMRQGELFGLQWDSVDLQRGLVVIRHSLEELKGHLRLKEPKSESGRRSLFLPQMAIEAIREHKAKMLEEGLESSTYVFTDTDGGPLRKCNFHRKTWAPLRKKMNLDGLHFHDLRHSCASMMLADGVNVKAIQTILGHSTISMTMDTYAHLMPNAQADAASRFDRLLSTNIK